MTSTHPQTRRPIAVTYESADLIRAESAPDDVQVMARSLTVLEQAVELGTDGPLGPQVDEIAALVRGQRNDAYVQQQRATRHVLVMSDHCHRGHLGIWLGRGDAWEATIAAMADYPRRRLDVASLRVTDDSEGGAR